MNFIKKNDVGIILIIVLVVFSFPILQKLLTDYMYLGSIKFFEGFVFFVLLVVYGQSFISLYKATKIYLKKTTKFNINAEPSSLTVYYSIVFLLIWFTRSCYEVFTINTVILDIIFVLIVPTQLIQIFFINSEKYYSIVFDERLLILKSKSSVTTMSIILITGNYLSGSNLVISFAISIVLMLLVLLTLEETNNATNNYFGYLSYLLTISINLAKIGGDASAGNFTIYKSFILAGFLLSWFIPYLEMKLVFTEDQKNLLEKEIDVYCINNRNKLTSQIFFFQMNIRMFLNKFSNSLLGIYFYMCLLININNVLLRIFGPLIAINFSIMVISIEYFTRVTAYRLIVNPKLRDLTLNNLPEFQKRQMKNVMKTVVDCTTNNPAAALALGGTLLATGVNSVMNVFTVDAMNATAEATKEATAAMKESIEATKEATAATKEGTGSDEQARKDENRRSAIKSLESGGVQTEQRKQSLTEQINTGEIPKNITESILAENEARIKSKK